MDWQSLRFLFSFVFFSSKYYLACLQFILSFRRWIYIRMEHKKQSLEFWNHSERVDGNLPAEVNYYKPRVMFARPCLSRDTMRAHKEFRRTCKLALWRFLIWKNVQKLEVHDWNVLPIISFNVNCSFLRTNFSSEFGLNNFKFWNFWRSYHPFLPII